MNKVSETYKNDSYALDVRNANVLVPNGKYRHGQEDEDEQGKEEDKEPEDPGTWKEAFLKACEDCSFQGISLVVADTPFPLRR